MSAWLSVCQLGLGASGAAVSHCGDVQALHGGCPAGGCGWVRVAQSPICSMCLLCLSCVLRPPPASCSITAPRLPPKQHVNFLFQSFNSSTYRASPAGHPPSSSQPPPSSQGFGSMPGPNPGPGPVGQPGPGAPKGMGLAQKLLEKMGWREGQGLGRNRQGMATPLVAQKTAAHAGVWWWCSRVCKQLLSHKMAGFRCVIHVSHSVCVFCQPRWATASHI
jgi:hypothetical protein